MSTEISSDRKNTLQGCEPRLAFHPMIEERFGINKAAWKSLVEAIFPNATTINSIILALSYCQARKLDPFKRCVHIVPIYNSQLRAMVDTVWPGIGELRTTAFRTRQYAGRGPTQFGPDVTKDFHNADGVVATVTYPEWAQVSVYRMVDGQRVEFAGPRVYWIETYANKSHKDDTPNSMWVTRPRGQIDKCAEAAALRSAFPEEIGSEYIPEEVQRRAVDGIVTATTDPDVPVLSKVEIAKEKIAERREAAKLSNSLVASSSYRPSCLRSSFA
jgi:phage recombination protein Bet